MDGVNYATSYKLCRVRPIVKNVSQSGETVVHAYQWVDPEQLCNLVLQLILRDRG